MHGTTLLQPDRLKEAQHMFKARIQIHFCDTSMLARITGYMNPLVERWHQDATASNFKQDMGFNPCHSYYV